MDIDRVISFILTMVIIYILKSVIKFGLKVLVLLVLGAAFVYFVAPELVPVIMGCINRFIG